MLIDFICEDQKKSMKMTDFKKKVERNDKTFLRRILRLGQIAKFRIFKNMALISYILRGHVFDNANFLKFIEVLEFRTKKFFIFSESN